MWRFNEAEAQSPRKGAAHSSAVSATFRFNEAEAQSPRKGLPAGEGLPARAVASMRPRRNRLGRGRAATRLAVAICCFNEAEAQSPRKGIWPLVRVRHRDRLQ